MAEQDPALVECSGPRGRWGGETRETVEELGRERGRTADEEPHPGEVGGVGFEVVAEPLVHRGDPEEKGAAGFQLRHHAARFEADHGHLAAGQQAAGETHREAVDVAERQRADDANGFGPAPGLDRASILGTDVAAAAEGPV